MIQKVNKCYEPLFINPPRYVILMGGRGAGRSTVASQYANANLMAKDYFRCAIMRYVLGDIRNSIYREILDRLEETGVIDNVEINDNPMVITYGKNRINAVGFRKSSSDQRSKLKSLANYTTVIIEEADETDEADFMQLDDSLRTIKGDIVIILLLNPPPKDHWIIQRWFNLKPTSLVSKFYTAHLKDVWKDNTLFISTNFRDNEVNMSKDSMDNYRRYKITKPDYYWNVIEGLIPETVRGRIYNGWKEIDEIPHEAKLVRRGLDFGYSNDPTAIVDVYKYDDGYVLDERLYRKKMKNVPIADFLLNMEDPNMLVIGDSSEPKSIDEIADQGVTILGAKKQKREEEGKKMSYLNWRIQKMQNLKISYTSRSKNLKKEYENYAWMEDKEGNGLNVPIDKWNDLMDASGYALVSLLAREEVSEADRRKVQGIRQERLTNNDSGL